MSSAQKVAQAIGPGHATLSMTVMGHMANGQKLCHGGYLFMLADSAFGYACNSHNQRALSASASIDYLAPAHVRDRLTARAREMERLERRGIYDVTSATIRGTWT